MARFAPVVPIHMAEQLQQPDSSEGKDHLGRYHLILAHDVLDKPEEYKRVFKKVREDYFDSFIIMDNSIVELGSAMKMDDLIEACRIVSPDCLVVPDVMGQGAATRRMSTDFVREYVRELAKGLSDEMPSLMGVLQGESVADCMETCGVYYTMPMVEYISVPRIITQNQGSRMPVLMALAERNTYSLFDGVHLLGFSDDVLDDISCARIPWVMGIDSAVPIRAGMKGIPIHYALSTPDTFKIGVGSRGDFWDQTLDPKTNERLVRANLDQYRDWIKLVR